MKESRLKRLGNSLAVLIPKAVRDLLNWDQDTELQMEVFGNRLIVEPKAEPQPKPNLFKK